MTAGSLDAPRDLPAPAPWAGLGADLAAARDVDEVAVHVLRGLAGLPGVLRVGFALSEGGGRRLRFTAGDREHAGGVEWCHIDAYDDVPLTSVMRSGAPVRADRALLDRSYPEYAGRQHAGVRGIAAVPLPGVGGPVGGVLLVLDRPWQDGPVPWARLEAAARQASDAVRRTRISAAPRPGGDGSDAADDHDASGAHLELPDDPRSAGRARRFLRDFLADHGDAAGVTDDLAETATLCLSEVVTNALVHAGGTSELRITLDDRALTVSVRDHGATCVPADRADAIHDPMLVHGRGLQLVDMLVDRWGAERDSGGATTWFVLELHRPAQWDDTPRAG